MNLHKHLLGSKEAEQQDKDGLIKEMSWMENLTAKEEWANIRPCASIRPVG